MASRPIQFVRGAQKSIFSGRQPLTQAIDLGGLYRVLDLELRVYGMTSTAINVGVITGMTNEFDLPWATLGTFDDVLAADTSKSMIFTGALRYVRFEVSLSGGGATYFTLNGVARTAT